MVDIAQLVSASDCGSEGRGFESHYPPHKETLRFAGGFLYGIFVDNEIRRERPAQRAGKKHAGGMFFSSGENPIGRRPMDRYKNDGITDDTFAMDNGIHQQRQTPEDKHRPPEFYCIFSSFSSTLVKYSGSGAKTITGRPSLGWAKHSVPAWRHWLSWPSSGFLWP